MNTELRAGLEMKDALLRRLSQEERNNFIGLQDLGVSAILSGGEPVSAVATIAAKKYAEKVAP
jgi:predicted PP-loop superfamily ATPase